MTLILSLNLMVRRVGQVVGATIWRKHWSGNTRNTWGLKWVILYECNANIYSYNQKYVKKLVGEYLQPTKNFISQGPSDIRVVQQMVCSCHQITFMFVFVMRYCRRPCDFPNFVTMLICGLLRIWWDWTWNILQVEHVWMTKYLMNYQSMYTRSGSYMFVILT
jgi:hypothetical protein